MSSTERRAHRRLPLHLAVTGADQTKGSWVTGNVSVGGMYVRVPASQVPQEGSALEFSLAVPPGAGHWDQPSCVRGRGRVVRVDELRGGQAGVAVQFAAPLAVRL